MFRIILTAAALTFSGPALAASQLELSLGVNPDAYSTAQLAELLLLDDDSPRVHFKTKGTLVISTHDYAGDRALTLGDDETSTQLTHRN